MLTLLKKKEKAIQSHSLYVHLLHTVYGLNMHIVECKHISDQQLQSGKKKMYQGSAE